MLAVCCLFYLPTYLMYSQGVLSGVEGLGEGEATVARAVCGIHRRHRQQEGKDTADVLLFFCSSIVGPEDWVWVNKVKNVHGQPTWSSGECGLYLSSLLN